MRCETNINPISCIFKMKFKFNENLKITGNMTKDKIQSTKKKSWNDIYLSFSPTFNENIHLDSSHRSYRGRPTGLTYSSAFISKC